jgi:hypothetical protein
MVHGKAAMIGRVPILRRHYKWKHREQAVGHRKDGIAIKDRQGSTGKKIVLKINENEAFHIGFEQGIA